MIPADMHRTEKLTIPETISIECWSEKSSQRYSKLIISYILNRNS